MSRSPGFEDVYDDYRRSRSRSYSRSRSPESPPRRRRSYHSPSPPRRKQKRHSSSQSRSYTPSPPPRGRRHYGGRYSRSRSRSFSSRDRRGHRERGRHRSRSPMSDRKRHQGNRFNPSPCRVLGVFGLSLYTGEKEIKEMFDRYGPLDRVQVVYDHQTGRSRGFAFIYFSDVEDAVDAKERCNGMEVDGRRIRVDYSITKRPHTPTPGVYMGRPTRGSPEEREHRGDRGDRGDRGGRSNYY